MQAKDLAKLSLSSNQHMMQMYLSDLSDADLFVHPVPGANHIAWQIGHLISSEIHLLEGLLPGVKYPELPPALKNHPRDPADTPRESYLTKDEYLDWSNKVHTATLEAVDKLSDADLDIPTPGPMAKFAPNLGAMLNMVSTHLMMHAGQFTVVRRALKKPVLF